MPTEFARPAGDGTYLIIELDFDTKEEADAFREFLTTIVWSNSEASPALDGTPKTRILEPVAS